MQEKQPYQIWEGKSSDSKELQEEAQKSETLSLLTYSGVS